jgi:four helix bundle protein
MLVEIEMNYQNLEIWQIAKELSIDIHKMRLTELPKFEMFEEGSQIRRSSKSVRSNIVEGYGRRIYKMDYVKHLIYAQASNDETIDHLETLFETKSLKNEKLFEDLLQRLNTSGKKLNKAYRQSENMICLPETSNQ